jgi:hypothetical protein
MRVDACSLCYHLRRPVWVVAEDIGTWYSVFTGIGFLAVMTNATMIFFVSKQGARDEEEALGGLAARLENGELWAGAILLEHGVIFARVLILMVTPSTPRWLTTARDELNYHLGKVRPAPTIERIINQHEAELMVSNPDDIANFDRNEYMETLLAGRPKHGTAEDLVLELKHHNIRDHMDSANDSSTRSHTQGKEPVSQPRPGPSSEERTAVKVSNPMLAMADDVYEDEGAQNME